MSKATRRITIPVVFSVVNVVQNFEACFLEIGFLTNCSARGADSSTTSGSILVPFVLLHSLKGGAHRDNLTFSRWTTPNL